LVLCVRGALWEHLSHLFSQLKRVIWPTFLSQKKKKKRKSWRVSSLCCLFAFQLLNYVISIHDTYCEHYLTVVDPSIVLPSFLRFSMTQRRHTRTWGPCDSRDTLGYANRRNSGGSHDDVSSGMMRSVDC